MSTTGESCCPAPGPSGRCTLEAIVSVDDRGQMVLPKDLRARAGIGAGSKLAVISWEKDGETCCITLLRADRLNDSVRSVVGPMVQDALSNEEST
jgi:antitoxin PrlF